MYLYNYSKRKIDEIKPDSIVELDKKDAIKYFKMYFGEVFIFEHKITVKKAKEFVENTSFIFNYFNESINELKGLIITEAKRATNDVGKLRYEVRKKRYPDKYKYNDDRTYPIETLEDKYSYQYLEKIKEIYKKTNMTINDESHTVFEWCKILNKNYDFIIECYVSNSEGLSLWDIMFENK